MRKEVIGSATLYLGDCHEAFPLLPSEAAIITDPPYGIAHQHSGGGQGAHKRRNAKMPIVGDASPFEPQAWLTFSNVLMWGADHFYPRLPDSGRWLAWDKLDGMEPWDSFSDVEFAWHSADRAARIFSMKWKGIACDKVGESNGARQHPTQKPIALMSWCIKEAKLAAGQIVIDPYMGTGTTGVAATRAGHPFIGVEVDPTYFAIACSRIDVEQRQERMFA